jgi:hypothetical protein
MFVLCPGTIMMSWQSPARLGTRGPQRSASVWMPIGCRQLTRSSLASELFYSRLENWVVGSRISPPTAFAPLQWASESHIKSHIRAFTRNGRSFGRKCPDVHKELSPSDKEWSSGSGFRHEWSWSGWRESNSRSQLGRLELSFVHLLQL